MSQSLEILNIFNTLSLKQIFWKKKTFFKKLEDRLWVDSTKIENATVSIQDFPVRGVFLA